MLNSLQRLNGKYIHSIFENGRKEYTVKVFFLRDNIRSRLFLFYYLDIRQMKERENYELEISRKKSNTCLDSYFIYVCVK